MEASVKSMLPLVVVLLLFGPGHSHAENHRHSEDLAIPGDAMEAVIREGGNPADIILGGGMPPWLSDKAGWLGDWITGFPRSKARQYRAALRDIFLDAQVLGLYQGVVVEDLDSFCTHEVHT